MTLSSAENHASETELAQSWDVFCKDYEEVMRMNRFRIHFFFELVHRLNQMNIPILPLKGLDLLLRAYPLPGMRPMADLDLLIRAKDVRKVMMILDQLGFRRKPDEGLTYLSPDGQLNLDILWDIWYLSKKDHDDLWARTVMENNEVRMLFPEDAVIYLLAYTVAHRGSLSHQLKQDIEVFGCNHPIDWKWIAAEAGRLGLRPALFRGLEYIQAESGDLFRPRSLSEKIKTGLYQKLVTERPRLHVSYSFTWLEYCGWRGKWKLLREKFFPTPFEVEIRRGRKGFMNYLFFIATHPFILTVKALASLFK